MKSTRGVKPAGTAKVETANPAAPKSGAPFGRRERRAAETRLRLFRAALQLFSERGFFNVTVEEITDAADVGKGTFFNYFENKDHVLGVMAEIQLSKVSEAVQMAAAGKQTIRQLLHSMFLRLAEEPGRSADLARALISSFLGSEGVRKNVCAHMAEGQKQIAGVIQTAQQRGEIDRTLEPEKVALQLLQTVLGTVLLWSLRGERPLSLAMEDSFTHFWTAVGCREQEPPARRAREGRK